MWGIWVSKDAECYADSININISKKVIPEEIFSCLSLSGKFLKSTIKNGVF
jgi:hypothetical protein